MDITQKLHTIVDSLGTLPGLIDLRKARYHRRFATAERVNLFHGVYPDAAAAAAAIPPTKPAGYDNDAPAAMYDERTRQVYASDYPVLFWLSTLLTEQQCRVFDVGGHIGVGYYAYESYLRYPSVLQWCVSDVPAVAERGRELAKTKDLAGRLTFTSDLNAADGFDILFASGSIQYLPVTLGQLLAGLANKPLHVLVNLLPLHASETYFTVQNIGTAFCPYRIESREAFVAGVTAAGYRLCDSWENLDKRCSIPFVEAHYSLDRYYGFYFERI
jgi:putative methyltransferase (TIGR04325 family)